MIASPSGRDRPAAGQARRAVSHRTVGGRATSRGGGGHPSGRGAAASRTRQDKFTQATPHLYAKFNYRIKWFDGWENHKLSLDDYNWGPSAPYKSWVLLEKVDGVEDA